MQILFVLLLSLLLIGTIALIYRQNTAQPQMYSIGTIFVLATIIILVTVTLQKSPNCGSSARLTPDVGSAKDLSDIFNY